MAVKVEVKGVAVVEAETKVEEDVGIALREVVVAAMEAEMKVEEVGMEVGEKEVEEEEMEVIREVAEENPLEEKAPQLTFLQLVPSHPVTAPLSQTYRKRKVQHLCADQIHLPFQVHDLHPPKLDGVYHPKKHVFSSRLKH